MGIVRFRRIPTQDSDLGRVQDSVSESIYSLQTSPLAECVVISGIALKAAGVDSLVPHRLGRKITGYVIVKSSADVRVWDSPSRNPDEKLFAVLRSSVAATVSILFF